ncbi:hypothetical protein HVE01_20110 [Vreelandella venusta]|nr:hypothetical protein HVE01_20110 [Halomonas venusta]
MTYVDKGVEIVQVTENFVGSGEKSTLSAVDILSHPLKIRC